MSSVYSNKPIIIAIEGNIGAGKSTFLRHLKDRFAGDSLRPPCREASRGSQVLFMQEPVDIWESVRDESTGETILSKFYADKEKYAFAFQIMAYTSRLEAFRTLIRANPECRVIICERSLEADRHIFAKMLHDDGLIDSVSSQVYEMLFKNTSHEFKIDMAVYLDAAPEKCAERIAKRAREGESLISTAYLANCKRYYDNWMAHMCDYTDTTVIQIDANVDTSYNSESEFGPQWIELVKQLAESFLDNGLAGEEESKLSQRLPLSSGESLYESQLEAY